MNRRIIQRTWLLLFWFILALFRPKRYVSGTDKYCLRIDCMNLLLKTFKYVFIYVPMTLLEVKCEDNQRGGFETPVIFLRIVLENVLD